MIFCKDALSKVKLLFGFKWRRGRQLRKIFIEGVRMNSGYKEKLRCRCGQRSLLNRASITELAPATRVQESQTERSKTTETKKRQCRRLWHDRDRVSNKRNQVMGEAAVLLKPVVMIV
jgi:hypothetical protein